MDGVTLEKIHEDLLLIKKDLDKIRIFFEEDKLELLDEIKRQVVQSRERPISQMIPQEEVEKEFL